MNRLAHYRRLKLLLLLLLWSLTAGGGFITMAGGQTYTDNEKGLKKLVSNLLRLADQRKEAEFSALASPLALPNYAEWFVRTFGENKGAEISQAYAQLSGKVPAVLFPAFSQLAATRFRGVDVRRAITPCIPGVSLDHLRVLEAQKNPTPLYVVMATNGDQGRSLGFFVFVDNAFRWIGNLRFGKADNLPETSPQPVARIGPGSPIERAIPPVYPPEARQARVQGTVRLSAVITREGIIRDLYYQDGPCLLAEAAMTAVSQWRYKPTRLNGELVEVTTTIDVAFTLSN